MFKSMVRRKSIIRAGPPGKIDLYFQRQLNLRGVFIFKYTEICYTKSTDNCTDILFLYPATTHIRSLFYGYNKKRNLCFRS